MCVTIVRGPVIDTDSDTTSGSPGMDGAFRLPDNERRGSHVAQL